MSPKLLSMLKNKDLNNEQIKKDIIAGMIVAIIALPLCIALAMSSGVSPEKGLITAIFAGFIISVFGGSKVQIGGPTAAFVVIVYGVIKNYGVEGLVIATMMAGVILIIMGLLRLGSLIKYVPKTITVGFTAGIAVSLFLTQLKDLFGFKIADFPAKSLEKIEAYIENLSTVDLETFVVGIGCVLVMTYWPNINKKIPGSIIALVLATIIVKIFSINIDTIGSVSSNISSQIPTPYIPKVSLSKIKDLISPAFSIAVLAAIQALLSCVVTDEMIEDKHDSNTELIAQGIGNITSALFGGMPVTGAVARTISNVKNNGRSPIAGITHCAVLLFVMVFLMPLIKLIPMTVLSAILVVVSYNMGDWVAFKSIVTTATYERIVLLTTFILTIALDLVFAICVGMIIHTLFNMIKNNSKEKSPIEEAV